MVNRDAGCRVGRRVGLQGEEKVLPPDGDADRARLLADAGIIRNRLKVNAAIENARRIEAMGSFSAWLDERRGLALDAWAKEFKRTFLFTGGEIVREFLVSTGYLPGAHDEDCAIFQKIKR